MFDLHSLHVLLLPAVPHHGVFIEDSDTTVGQTQGRCHSHTIHLKHVTSFLSTCVCWIVAADRTMGDVLILNKIQIVKHKLKHKPSMYLALRRVPSYTCVSLIT